MRLKKIEIELQGWGDDKGKYKGKITFEDHLWWSGYKWTNDPLEAFGCDLKPTADRYARFQLIKDYIITEHEFVNSKSVGGN